MNFLNPWGLLALATVPFLILLYFLKLKRPSQQVSSTLLWQKVIEDVRVNSPFQRLRRNLLLLIQLLLLLALIFALARPLFKGDWQRGTSYIVLLDNSASMAAIEPDGRRRFDIAREQIADLAANLPEESEMVIVTFNLEAQQVCPFTGNERQLKQVIADLDVTEAPTDVALALRLASTMANARTKPRVILFSDGGFQDPGSIPLNAPIEYRAVGSDRPNVAISGLDIRRDARDRERVEMFVNIQNFGETAQQGNMRVLLNDQVLDSKFVDIGGGKSLAKIFVADLPEGGVLAVELDIDDALPADNRAWQVVPAPRDRRLMIVGERVFFLERAFRAAPDIDIMPIAPDQYSDAEARACSVVVWVGVEDPVIAPASNLYFGCAPAIEGLTLGEAISNPAIVEWDSTHPLARFLDFSNIVISQSPTMVLPPGSDTVVRGNRTPLIGSLEHGDNAVCVVAFDPLRSNWPLLVSFPLFLHNTLEWFDQRQARNQRTNIPVGASLTMPAQDAPPTVTRPDGRVAELTGGAGGEWHYAKVDRAGIYALRTAPDSEPLRVAANLFNSRESELTLVEDPIQRQGRVERAAVNKPTFREYGRWLLLAAVVLVLIEWIVYHRRILT